MKIGIAGGTGQLGYGLALRFYVTGYKVVVGSRQLAKAEEAVAKLTEAGSKIGEGKGSLTAATIEGCAAQSDIIFLAVPFAAQLATTQKLYPGCIGKVVVDTTVPLAPGNPTEIQVMYCSAAEGVQTALGAETKVVSGFHTVSHTLLSNLEKTLEGDVLICGDDEGAKNQAIEIAAKIGMRGIDAGPLTNSRTLERITPLIIGMNKRYKKRHIGLHFTGL
jgi:8-hydroxy-5-deazaflavin:NADPH oxidoreductase